MRKSAFGGSFYDSDKGKLLKFIDSAVLQAKVSSEVRDAVSYVAPHAGYMYSGNVAAYTYKALSMNEKLGIVDTIIVIGPNHTGMGTPISMSAEDWSTPLGKSVNDTAFSKAIAESESVRIDETAHAYEHSVEVQLPFIQHVAPGKKLVFICMGDQSLGASKALSKAIISAAEKLKRKAIVIASSDMNHYESEKIARAKDLSLLEAAKSLDYEKFNRLIDELQDSACGFGPITVAMLFGKHEGAKKGMLLKYGNSGDVTGDYSSVVAYPSIAFV